MVFTKENLLDLLRNNLVTVTFTKVNGDERVMNCTLRNDYIPNSDVSNTTSQVLRENTGRGDNNISVWDTKSNGWRSFRVNSVKSVSVGQ
jgi:hypothetical protein